MTGTDDVALFEELTELAKGYGLDLVLTAAGLGQVAEAADLLGSLLDLVAADRSIDALEKESRSMGIEYALGVLAGLPTE